MCTSIFKSKQWWVECTPLLSVPGWTKHMFIQLCILSYAKVLSVARNESIRLLHLMFAGFYNPINT